MATQEAVMDANGANEVLEANGTKGTNGINEIHDIHNQADTNDLNRVKDMHVQDVPELDVLIIGAGFSAFTLLNRFRKQGLKCKVYERGTAAGGIWYWNCYPGARVDSPTPIYQLFDKEVWEDFTFTEKYPAWPELQEYFKHVEKKYDTAKDVIYNKNVDNAVFDEDRKQWLIECSDGTRVYAKWLIPAVGFASRRYTPNLKGLSDFQGEYHHTASWPQYGVNLRNKRVAVIGTGASGIQVSQNVGPTAAHLTIFQRTPNLALPMCQAKLNPSEEAAKKADGTYAAAFKHVYTTAAGFSYDAVPRKTFDDSPAQREAFYQQIFSRDGGFRFWLGNYSDIFKDRRANDEAYAFWRRKVLARIPDPKKAAVLAPEKAPHPFGTKRPSLEQNFYEVASLPHVDIVDVNANPIEHVEAEGIRLRDGSLVELDVIVFATGFDSVTGGMAQMHIVGTHGKTIAEHWAEGTKSAYGIALSGFPNLFFLYGPQAPTAFSNGPSCVQVQADWVEKVVGDLERKGVKSFEVKENAEREWTRRNNEAWDGTLFPLAKSWYQGSNIPGKRVEPLNWTGGIPAYIEAMDKSIEKDYQDWILIK